MLTGSVLGKPGSLAACGLWQSVQSPMAPGCGTLAESISLALSSWQVTQIDLASAWVSTTLPSFAGAWQVSQLLASKGGCRNFTISLGDADWCGSWHSRQLAAAKGWFRWAFCRSASLASWQSRQRAGVALVRWKRFSGVGSGPVLWVKWQASQPISSAA